MDQRPSLRKWILDSLTNKPQTVRIHNISSSPIILSAAELPPFSDCSARCLKRHLAVLWMTQRLWDASRQLSPELILQTCGGEHCVLVHCHVARQRGHGKRLVKVAQMSVPSRKIGDHQRTGSFTPPSTALLAEHLMKGHQERVMTLAACCGAASIILHHDRQHLQQVHPTSASLFPALCGALLCLLQSVT